MRENSRSIFSFQSPDSVPFLSFSVFAGLTLLTWTLFATSLSAQKDTETPLGIAWRVRGAWQVNGKGAPIVTGDAMEPGSLLEPGNGTGNPSITVLLPDGQRILYECFTSEDCARGFRVPPLNRVPDPLAVDILAHIRAGLVHENHEGSTGSNVSQKTPLPRDEVVAVLDSDNRVEVGGLATKLPKGRYTYDLQPLDRAYPRQSLISLEKTAPSITVALPSAGLYALTIADDLNRPRIELFIAAVSLAQGARITKSFGDARGLLRAWNEDFYMWPIHDFQRAYLESLMLGAGPLGTEGQAGAAGENPSNVEPPQGNSQTDAAGVTAEPAFSPKPGLLSGDAQVALQCSTPGVIIHYTVDSSQPVASSPVYGAPIVVKATGLTIKAFSSAAGKKDSAVVTGIFRIRKH